MVCSGRACADAAGAASAETPLTLANPFDFSGKTVVLTGATGGLGRPIARAFATAGADLALCALRAAPLEELAGEISGGGGQVMTATVDLCVPGQVEGFAAAVRDRFKTIDVRVNLVGGIIRKPSLDYTLDEWQHVVDINLKACWLACQAYGRIMVAQKRGRIVNFTSNAGMHGVPGYPAYSPAKAGVIGLTRVLAVEWGPHGICTNALSPGFADTPLNADVLSDPKRVEAILRRMPPGKCCRPTRWSGRRCSWPRRWINGHTINVDTGFNAT